MNEPRFGKAERVISDQESMIAAQVTANQLLQAENARLQADISQLNALARQVGWGQGEIDSAATFAEENERLRQDQSDRDNEVASVLMLMDGLAEQWGDEGVFRRCRDRLRALLPQEPQS